MTRSAPRRRPRRRSSTSSAMPSSRTRAATASVDGRSATTRARASLCARQARAIDEPISPMPMSARRSKSGSRGAGPSRSGMAGAPARKSASAATTSRFASSLPTVRRSASRQAVGRRRARRIRPRAVRKASASFARLCPARAGKWTSRKLPTLGVTVEAERLDLAASARAASARYARRLLPIWRVVGERRDARPRSPAVDVEGPADAVQRVDDMRRRHSTSRGADWRGRRSSRRCASSRHCPLVATSSRPDA